MNDAEYAQAYAGRIWADRCQILEENPSSIFAVHLTTGVNVTSRRNIAVAVVKGK